MNGSNANTIETVLLVISPFILSIIGFLSWVVKKLGTHDTSLALLIQQVNPPGDKSLRELLTDLRVEQGKISIMTQQNQITSQSHKVE